MAVQFIVDAASDITNEEAEKLGIKRIPMRVHFGEAGFEDLEHERFYEMLIESDILPTTAQVNPNQFLKVFEEILEGDEAVVLCLSSKLSGSFQNAFLSSQEMSDRIFAVDSENVSIGIRILLEQALLYREQGFSAKEIKEKLDEDKKAIQVIALLDTLEYLKKGGRISAGVAALGNLLTIKPVVSVQDGEVHLVGKARGSKNAKNLLRTLIDKTGGIDFSRPFALAYSGTDDQMLRKYIQDSEDLWQTQTEALPVYMIGPVIGTHIGPGGIALAYYSK